MGTKGKSMTEIHPKLKRGRVWCIKCGNTFKVNASQCLQKGWPKCHGQTMTIDSPQERKAKG